MLVPAQIRAARALLNISQHQLAELSGVGSATIKRIELGEAQGRKATLDRLQTTLEGAGVEFLTASQTAGPGVRLAHVRTCLRETKPNSVPDS